MLRCDSDVSLIMWSDTLDYAVRQAVKYPAADIDSIDISKT